MHLLKSSLAALTLALGLTHTGTADAALISWTVGGVTFDDGGTVTGSFTTDSTTGFLQSWNLTTTAGTALAGRNFDLTNSRLNATDDNEFIVTDDS